MITFHLKDIINNIVSSHKKKKKSIKRKSRLNPDKMSNFLYKNIIKKIGKEDDTTQQFANILADLNEDKIFKDIQSSKFLLFILFSFQKVYLKHLKKKLLRKSNLLSI